MFHNFCAVFPGCRPLMDLILTKYQYWKAKETETPAASIMVSPSPPDRSALALPPGGDQPAGANRSSLEKIAQGGLTNNRVPTKRTSVDARSPLGDVGGPRPMKTVEEQSCEGTGGPQASISEVLSASEGTGGPQHISIEFAADRKE
eukprot:gene29067-32272_t